MHLHQYLETHPPAASLLPPSWCFAVQPWGSSSRRGYCHQRNAVLFYSFFSFRLANKLCAAVEDTVRGFQSILRSTLHWQPYLLLAFPLMPLCPSTYVLCWPPYKLCRSGEVFEAETLVGLNIFLPWEIQPLVCLHGFHGKFIPIQWVVER